jgi:hypothetical protein
VAKPSYGLLCKERILSLSSFVGVHIAKLFIVFFIINTITFVFYTKRSYLCRMTIEEIKEQAEGAIILDGLDDAIIGMAEEFGNGPRIVYSKSKIFEILRERDGMDEIEAVEFYEFNILGLFASPQNAIFLEDTY